MKRLSKLKLHNATVLSDYQMKGVVGGYGYDGYGTGGKPCAYFECSCRNGFNPGYDSVNFTLSCDTNPQTMADVIRFRCANGEGGCVQITKDN